MGYHDDDNTAVDPFAMPELLSVGNEVMAGMPLPTEIGADGKTAEEAASKGIYSPDLISKIYDTKGGNVSQTLQDNSEEGQTALDAIREDLGEVDEDNNAVNESLEELTTLIGFLNTMRQQGLSKDLVYQVESLCPSLITSKIPIGRISTMPSQSGYQIGMEGMGKTIKEFAIRIIESIRTRFNKLMEYIKSKLFNKDLTMNKSVDEMSQEELYKKALDNFKARAAEKGTKAYLSSLTNDPFAIKAGSVEEYLDFFILGNMKRGYGDKINILQKHILENNEQVGTEVYNCVCDSINFFTTSASLLKKISQTDLEKYSTVLGDFSKISPAIFHFGTTDSSQFIKQMHDRQDYLIGTPAKFPSRLRIDKQVTDTHPFGSDKMVSKLTEISKQSEAFNKSLIDIQKEISQSNLPNKPDGFDRVLNDINEVSVKINGIIRFIGMYKSMFDQYFNLREQVLKRALSKSKH